MALMPWLVWTPPEGGFCFTVELNACHSDPDPDHCQGMKGQDDSWASGGIVFHDLIVNLEFSVE